MKEGSLVFKSTTEARRHGEQQRSHRSHTKKENSFPQTNLPSLSALIRVNQRQIFLSFSVSPCLRGRCYVSVEVALLDGSSACRCGPLPLNHNDPPCSRKAVGATGSSPRVISSAFFSECFALIAANTRSGVNGASRSRTPTAS